MIVVIWRSFYAKSIISEFSIIVFILSVFTIGYNELLDDSLSIYRFVLQLPLILSLSDVEFILGILCLYLSC